MSATPAKTKKAAKPKKPAAHPKYAEMIKQAVSSLKERKGSSRAAILKYIAANFKIEQNASTNSHLKMALKKAVSTGVLKQVSGTGAAGSFKLGEAKEKKPKVKKPKAAKAAKKPKATKPAGEKKPKVKKAKTPKKKAAAKPKKSPAKKAAKPKKSPAKKAAKKAKSPKKPAKKAAKK